MNQDQPSQKIQQFDALSTVVRALVLYSLAEFQAGHVTTLRIEIEGRSFRVSDDGRGHAIDRETIGGTYLQFIYKQLDYPFAQNTLAPIQLQGIGMSLVNALCDELFVEVKKQYASLQLAFTQTEKVSEKRIDEMNAQRGNSISGSVREDFPVNNHAETQIRNWLLGVLKVSPKLAIFFNSEFLRGSV